MIAGDYVTVVKIFCDCVPFCSINYGKPHPYHNYIERIRGHDPGWSSKHGAYWSDPLLLELILAPVNISESCNAPT